MCRAPKSSKANNPIGIWTKDPRRHRTGEMHENIRLLAAGEATAAHHHLPYQRKTASQTGTGIPRGCVASQPHFRIGSWEAWIHMATKVLPRSQNVLTVPTCHAHVEPEYPPQSPQILPRSQYVLTVPPSPYVLPESQNVPTVLIICSSFNK